MAARSPLRRLPLKSKTGCATCRRRRKKCDETRPCCEACLRLSLSCLWSPPRESTTPTGLHGNEISQPIATSLRVQNLENMFKVPHGSPVASDIEELPILDAENISDADSSPHRKAPEIYNGQSMTCLKFDHPSTLRASPTSIIDSAVQKQVLQYLSERGSSIARHALPITPEFTNYNSFMPGVPMARKHPVLMTSYLALAAAHLSLQNSQFSNIAAGLYQKSMRHVNQEIGMKGASAASEPLCISALTLSLYEMVTFSSLPARLAHLLGFHHLMQAKLRDPDTDWTPRRGILVHYIFVLSVSSLFYGRILLSNKSLNYINDLIGVLSFAEIPVGLEIVGIPRFMLEAVYKLSFLRLKDTTQPQWFGETLRLFYMLEYWQPDPTLLMVCNGEMLILARLFQLACQVFVSKLIDHKVDGFNPKIQHCVQQSLLLVNKLTPEKPPLISLAWPLIILSVAAVEWSDVQMLQGPIKRLIEECGLRAHVSILGFIEAAWGDGPRSPTFIGLNILFYDELLGLVHI